MKCYINNNLIPDENVTVGDFGFGKKVPNPFMYLLTIKIEDFIMVTQPIFDSYMETMKEDDERFGVDIDDKDSVYMSERGYPKYTSVLISDKAFIETFFIETFVLEFLSPFFKERDQNKWLYVINSLDSITIKEDTVEVRGEAFEIKRSN